MEQPITTARIVTQSSFADPAFETGDNDTQELHQHKRERGISENSDLDQATISTQEVREGAGGPLQRCLGSSNYQHPDDQVREGVGGPLQGCLTIPVSHDGRSSNVSVKSARSIIAYKPVKRPSGRGAGDFGSQESQRLRSSPDAQSGGDRSWWPFSEGLWRIDKI